MIETYVPGRYLKYAELTALLKAYAERYPDLCQLAEAGRSAEGRSIWAVTLTNQATGPDRNKPGYMVDANTHAGEVTGGAAAVYTIHWLLTNYGLDPLATDILDTRAFYVIPRIAVDGVEAYLTSPVYLRSSPKLYPFAEEPERFYPADMNGDGRILRMRKVDPNGDWKVDAQDPRLMVPRQPEDREGIFYRIFPEGEIRGAWDGRALPKVVRAHGMDFNRNYPAFWNPEGKQPGAGQYPLSEPETRAVARFILVRPNIGAYVAYHTTGGVLLRPPSNGGDEKMNQADLEVFKRVGEVCTRVTNYPCKSTYAAFSYAGQEALVKGADDWAYEHLGVQAYCFELWDRAGKAGTKGYAQVGVAGLIKMTDEEQAEDERKLLAWNDKELEGKGFIPWTHFDHPQLGDVEIGGWDPKFCVQNPPEGRLLEEEITKAAAFTFQHALATPRLALELKAEQVGSGLYKVSAKVTNLGGLATNVTQQAVAMKHAPAIKVALEGAQVLYGKPTQEVGHLEGWAVTGGRAAKDEAWVDWLVSAAPGTTLNVSAFTPRAGRTVATLTL